jgi:hypothetical protein
MLAVEKAIEEKLRAEGPCGFEEVVMGLRKFTWAQIFVAVDCMSREGRLSLRQLGYSTYQISLGSKPLSFVSHIDQGQRSLDFKGMEKLYDLSKMSEPER